MTTPLDDGEMVGGEVDGASWVAWVVKRTFRVENGVLELAPLGDQEDLFEGEILYDNERPAPRVSPPVVVGDLFAFRKKTDVVVQAFAYPSRPNTSQMTVGLRFGSHRRSIVVFGDRLGELDRFGRARFSEPGPIDVVPLRYDFAYGGVDVVALRQEGDEAQFLVEKMRPELGALPNTAYHYPRNPTGMGYVMDLENSFLGFPVPHLEYPFDPLSPERMVVDGPEHWLKGPLPACWDWQSAGWFPRLSYLGLGPPPHPDDGIPEEVKRGYAPADIFDIEAVHHAPNAPLRPEFAQCASPGMSVSDIGPGTSFELTSVHPTEPTFAFRLPNEEPRVLLHTSTTSTLELVPHLSSVTVRPVPGEVVVVWSARAPLPLLLTMEQAADARRTVTWRRASEERS